MVLHKAQCRFLLWQGKYELSDRWDHVTVDSGFLDRELKTSLDGCRQTSVNIRETRQSGDESGQSELQIEHRRSHYQGPECNGSKDNYDDACILSQSKSSQSRLYYQVLFGLNF